jgi:hypothetical protein
MLTNAQEMAPEFPACLPVFSSDRLLLRLLFFPPERRCFSLP